jgi:hypothetical protein
MPVRISVKASYGADYIAEDASDIDWTPLRGAPPSWMDEYTPMRTHNPPNFTTHSLEGTCDIAMLLLNEQPAKRMPYPELQILTAMLQDSKAKCEQLHCPGNLQWVDIHEQSIHLTYSSSVGFLQNGNPVEWNTEEDRWYGAIATCTNCGWKVPPSATSSIRPRLSAAVDLCFTTLSEKEPKPRWTKRGRRLRPGTDARSGFVELTDKGCRFIEAVVAGDFDSATSIIHEQILNFRQESTQFPSPEQRTPQAIKNTLDSGLTEGFPVRDFAVFVADNGPLNKDEERIFQMYYGRSFNHDCVGCKLGEIGDCSLKSVIQELSLVPSEGGCRVNLSSALSALRNGDVSWEQYALESRGRMQTGYQRLVRTDNGETLDAMEWTWQLDKEGINQIRAFAKHAGAVDTGGSRSNRLTWEIAEIDIANMEQMDQIHLSEPPFSGIRWSPAKFRLKCMER